jgi:hypothetical protein
VRDRLWFFESTRAWGSTSTVAGDYYNATPQSFQYTPDFTRPAVNNFINRNEHARVTWQASPRNKIVLTYNYQTRCDCHRGIDGTGTSAGNLPSNAAPLSPEATEERRYIPNQIIQGTWTYPASSKLLLDAAVVGAFEGWVASLEPGVAPGTIGIQELSTGLYYHAPWGLSNNHNRDLYARFNTSYVTGSHALKAGAALISQWSYNPTIISSNLQYVFRNGSPNSLIEWATPYTTYLNMPADLGAYVQDQWTLKRLTLNAGLRIDYLKATTPAQQVSATELVPARSYAQVDCVPCWWDLDPRVSAAYDVFGTGKTAVKVSLGRYVTLSNGLGINPLTTSVNNVTRSWNDADGDFVPDCILTNPAKNGECGPISASTFGQPTITTTYSPSVTNGFEVRPYSWQFSTGLQQELRSGMALNATYYRTSYGNFTATLNQAIPSSGFDPYCIPLPADPRLAGGGGNQVCGLYDINPSYFGQLSSLVTQASQFGTQTEVYNGVDVTVRARLPRGGFLQGGLNSGRTATNNCYANTIPNVTPSGFITGTPRTSGFCDALPPFVMQIKLNGAYPLPWSFEVSGNFQSLPGIPIVASYVATNAQILPSLGRSLSGGNTTATVANVIAPGALYESRITQLDFRLTKIVKLGRTRIQGMVDLYNVLNGSAILSENSRYGSAWLTPMQILDARLVKFGARVEF